MLVLHIQITTLKIAQKSFIYMSNHDHFQILT